MKECKSVFVYEYNPGKGIHYGLIILIELADNYYLGGCSLTHISESHDIPLYILIPIIYKIKEIGLIGCRDNDCDWLFLEKEPHNSWIIEVVGTLKALFKEK